MSYGASRYSCALHRTSSALQNFETVITLPFNPIWCKYKFKAKDFYATDSCIGCGTCEICPLNNIKLEDTKPYGRIRALTACRVSATVPPRQ